MRNTTTGNSGLRVTRRAVLAAIPVTLLATKANSLKSNGHEHEHHPKPPFDIRDQVPDAEQDDECIQCVYDAINRMVILIGNISFEQLFTLNVASLSPLVRPQIKIAAKFGLIRDVEEVLDLVDELVKEAGNSTITDFFALGRSAFSQRTVKILIELRRRGIRIPLPASDGSLAPDRFAAVQQLISVGPNLTFTNLFIDAKSSTPASVLGAVSTLQGLGLFAWFKNDRCCRGFVGASAVCDPFDGKLCIINHEGECTLISDECTHSSTSSTT